MSAKTHTHVSNREKPQQKGKEKEKKVVFKSVLDNPFRIRWPSVPVNMQNLILAQLVSLLEDVTKYNQGRDEANRKRKRAAHEDTGPRKTKKDKEGDASNTNEMVVDKTTDAEAPSSTSTAARSFDEPAPALLKHVVVGINAVTKRLESQIHHARHRQTLSNQPPTDELQLRPAPILKYVFVCRSDVDPPLLIDHLPHHVASYNSCKPPNVVKLIPLPKGAELTLADCFNVRRVATFALDAEIEGLTTLEPLLESIPTLAAHWLVPTPENVTIIPTHIKQVRTTAPKDMRIAKEERNSGRANAKKRKRQKKQTATAGASDAGS